VQDVVSVQDHPSYHHTGVRDDKGPRSYYVSYYVREKVSKFNDATLNSTHT
jgi:hypothetical protein